MEKNIKFPFTTRRIRNPKRITRPTEKQLTRAMTFGESDKAEASTARRARGDYVGGARLVCGRCAALVIKAAFKGPPGAGRIRHARGLSREAGCERRVSARPQKGHARASMRPCAKCFPEPRGKAGKELGGRGADKAGPAGRRSAASRKEVVRRATGATLCPREASLRATLCARGQLRKRPSGNGCTAGGPGRPRRGRVSALRAARLLERKPGWNALYRFLAGF